MLSPSKATFKNSTGANSTSPVAPVPGLTILSTPDKELLGEAFPIVLLDTPPSSAQSSHTQEQSQIVLDSQKERSPSRTSFKRVRDVARQLQFSAVNSKFSELHLSQPLPGEKRSRPSSPSASLPLDSHLEALFDRMFERRKKTKRTLREDTEEISAAP